MQTWGREVKNRRIAELIRTGVSLHWGIEVVIFTWTAKDTTYTYKVKVERVSKVKLIAIDNYAQGIIDCYNWR